MNENLFFSQPNKNKIINGCMRLAQRGTTVTNPANAKYTLDRWSVNNVADASVDFIQAVDAPTLAEAGAYSINCLHADVTVADASIGAGQYYIVRQFIEGYNTALFAFGQSGTRYVTLSFWHKHTKTGIYCVSITNSAFNRSYVAEYTQLVTDTWERTVITIPVDTTGTWLYDNGRGLNIGWALANGTTQQTAAGVWTAGGYFSTSNQVNALDSTSNNFKLALVQLEQGAYATGFENRSFDDEVAKCQRYYEKSYDVGTMPGTATNLNIWQAAAYSGSLSGAVMVYFLVTKRAAPVVSIWDGGGNAGKYGQRYGSSWYQNQNNFTVVESGAHGFYGDLSGTGAYAAIHYTAESEL
jgi:hypothetical protein